MSTTVPNSARKNHIIVLRQSTPDAIPFRSVPVIYVPAELFAHRTSTTACVNENFLIVVATGSSRVCASWPLPSDSNPERASRVIWLKSNRALLSRTVGTDARAINISRTAQLWLLHRSDCRSPRRRLLSIPITIPSRFSITPNGHTVIVLARR